MFRNPGAFNTTPRGAQIGLESACFDHASEVQRKLMAMEMSRELFHALEMFMMPCQYHVQPRQMVRDTLTVLPLNISLMSPFDVALTDGTRSQKPCRGDVVLLSASRNAFSLDTRPTILGRIKATLPARVESVQAE